MVMIRNQRHVSIQSDNGLVAANMLGCIQISILLTEQTVFIPSILENGVHLTRVTMEEWYCQHTKRRHKKTNKQYKQKRTDNNFKDKQWILNDI